MDTSIQPSVTASTKLEIEPALVCDQGLKSINEDCARIEYPDDPYLLESRGVVFAVADGVSSAEAGKEASETAVNRFIEDYYNTPDTWSVAKCGEKILSTINLRLFRKSHEFVTDTKGFLCTFSAVIIKSQTAHIFHVGDSRVYLLRNDTLKGQSNGQSNGQPKEGNLKQLTRDHTANIADGKSILVRALGMDNRLHVDYQKVPLKVGDRILLSSDGIHDFIPETKLEELLACDSKDVTENISSDAQLSTCISKNLKKAALANGSDDNLSALMAIIHSLPNESIDDYSTKLTRLPFPPDLEVGMKIDGYRIEKLMFASSRSQMYRVIDEATGQLYAMKTPSQNFVDDMNYIERFIQEEWIGCRVGHKNIVKVIPQSRAKTYLYYLMEWVEGQGLDKWMEHNRLPSPKRTIAIVKQISEGLKAFHQNETIHQDLKPANILIDGNDKITIVDFGSVYVAGLAEIHNPLEHEGALGTATYSDPYYLLGKNTGMQGDIYSLATIVYELFTGHLPYGEQVEQCQSKADYDRLRYQKSSEWNGVIPVWFDRTLEKGVSLELEQRYETLDEFMDDLTQPNPEFLKEDPVIEKNANTLMFWKLMSGFWFGIFILVIYLFSRVN